MSDEWENNTHGRCGECGAIGEPEGGRGNWSEQEIQSRSWSVPSHEIHYYEERWVCLCGCTWWEQYRWRGQTKESRR